MITAPDPGRIVPLDLNTSSGLIASSNDAQAFVWSLADGRGVAIDPSSLTAKPIATIPSAVASSLCSWDEMVWTGARVFLASTTDFALYDPASDTWTEGQLPAQRHCARKRLTVWTGSRVVLLGGSSAELADPNFAPITQAWMFDPSTLQWSTSSPAPSVRNGETSAAYVGGVIVVAGDGQNLGQTPTFLVYHPEADTWTELDPPGPLTYTPYVTAYDGQLVTIGLDNTASAFTDPNNPNWQSVAMSAPLDAGRHPKAFVNRGTRLVYLHGGSSSRVSIFDGKFWTETQPLSLPTSWDSPSVTRAGDFLIVAGATTGSAATAQAEALVVGVDALTDSLIFGD